MISSCKNYVNNPEPTESKFTYVDTLERNITDGIKIQLKNISDNYDINDTLQGQITLSNISDTTKFSVYFPIWPAYSLRVYDEKMNIVGGGPEVVSLVDVRYTLNIGDIHKYEISWSKNTSVNAMYGGILPACTGHYLLVFKLDGNVEFNNETLSKWIYIKPSGEQTCCDLHEIGSDQYDMAMYSLAMRNRFSTEVLYHFKDKPESNIYLIDANNKDTVNVDTIKFTNMTLKLAPKTDTLLFSYRLYKTEEKYRNLNGDYIVMVVIHFVEKDFELKRYTRFYN